MSLANSGGPRWIRKQKATQDKGLAGIAPIRRFLAALFGRSHRTVPAQPGVGVAEDGAASAEMLASRPHTVPALAGGAKARLEDGSL